jgi:hypothetical protein
MFTIKFDSTQFGLAQFAKFVSTFVENVDNSIYLNGHILLPDGTVVNGYMLLKVDSPINQLPVYYGEGDNEDYCFGMVVA